MKVDDLKSLQPFREIWLNLAANQRYAGLGIEEKDLESFRTRLANGGLPFLTRTLPTLGKALDASFALGAFECPPYFSMRSDGLPVFLGGPMKLALSGDSKAVDCVRQLTLMFYKLEVDHDPGTVDEFLRDFERVDAELSTIDWDCNNSLIDRAKLLIARVLVNQDPRAIRPCHGSGVTSCRTVNHEKWHKLRYYPKLDAYFPYPDYFFYSYTHLVDEMEKLKEAVVMSPTARVALVPKDSRGPRIISCEPAELLYIQQGLMRKLYRTMETHELTRGRINFSDQSINRELAHSSSMDGKMATIDLTDASDRVSLDLVRRIFPSNWVEALEASRSESTKLPNGRVVKLNKFAPMGSSCCFPIEALTFWSIACAAAQITLGLYPDVFVYGDDIIVPTMMAETVINALESVGLKVNRKKTFARGKFRESCGGEYHNGYDVTPVRVRQFLNASDTSLATDADLANTFVAKFGYGTIAGILSTIDSAHDQPFPRSSVSLPGTILFEPCASNDVFYRRRWSKKFQRFEHRILQLHSRRLRQAEPTWGELLRKELSRGNGKTDPEGFVSLNLDGYINTYPIQGEGAFNASVSDATLRDLPQEASFIDVSQVPVVAYKAFDTERERQRLRKDLVPVVRLDPGVYAVVHSAHSKWTWCWLG